jgi:hypothetical protein
LANVRPGASRRAGNAALSGFRPGTIRVGERMEVRTCLFNGFHKRSARSEPASALRGRDEPAGPAPRGKQLTWTRWFTLCRDIGISSAKAYTREPRAVSDVLIGDNYVRARQTYMSASYASDLAIARNFQGLCYARSEKVARNPAQSSPYQDFYCWTGVHSSIRRESKSWPSPRRESARPFPPGHPTASGPQSLQRYDYGSVASSRAVCELIEVDGGATSHHPPALASE